MNSVETMVFPLSPLTPYQNPRRPQPGTISTGAAYTVGGDISENDNIGILQGVSQLLDTVPADFMEGVGAAFNSQFGLGSSEEGWCVVSTAEAYGPEFHSHGTQSGYYVVVDTPLPSFEDEWPNPGFAYSDERVSQALTEEPNVAVEYLMYGIVLPPSWQVAQQLASVDLIATQREERKATASLGKRIHTMLPEFSEGDLAQLVGVTRMTWRGWTGGSTVARRSSRQRLLRLERILALRQRTDPDAPVSHWLDSPIGSDLQLTPARLLADGRDQLVAILAVRIPVPNQDGLRLDLPPALSELLNLARVDERMAWRRQLVATDDQGDSA